MGAKKMKKKPQTVAASLDAYSSGSIIGNDPYAMMRRSHSSSSNGSHASHGSSTSNFGNMFQRVNSMFGVSSRTPTPSNPSPTPSSSLRSSQKSVKLNYDEDEELPKPVTTTNKQSSNSYQKNSKPTSNVNKNKQVIETEYASSSENDSFNIKNLEDLSDFSDEGGGDPSPSVVVVKKQQANVKEPPKKTPSPTPNTSQTRQPAVAQYQQPVKKPEPVKSKPLYREPARVVHQEVLSEEENFSEDEFSDFGDDEIIEEHDDDAHNTTQESAFDDFEEEIIDDDDDHHHKHKQTKKHTVKDEDEFSDFDDNESFEDNFFETSNDDSFDDFDDEDEEEIKPPPKKEPQKPITIPTTTKPKPEPVKNPEPVIVKKPEVKPQTKPSEPAVVASQKPIEKEPLKVITLQKPDNETNRSASRTPSPTIVIQSEKETVPKETEASNDTRAIRKEEQPKVVIRTMEQKVPELQVEKTMEKVIEIPYRTDRKIEIVHEPEESSPVKDGRETVRVITIERQPETKPKDLHSISIGTDDLSKDARTYATQTAYHSQVFNTNYQGNNANIPSQPHSNLCCEHCNCNFYSPNFVPYYPPPLAYFRNPYAQAFPQRPLSSFSNFPRSNITPPSSIPPRQPPQTSSCPHNSTTPSYTSTTQTENQKPKPLFTKSTETERPIIKEKINFTPYIPDTRYLDEKNYQSNQKYQRFKETFSTKFKEPTTKASAHINEEHQRQSGFIRQELEEIKSLLLSSRQEMNVLLYNTRVSSNMGAYATTSPFEMKL